MLDESRRLQLALPILTLIQEEDLPQPEAENILHRAMAMLKAWHEAKDDRLR